jgi:hypothetical protein
VKNKYEKGIFNHFSFLRKKSIDLQKIENHVGLFLSIGFGLVTIFQMFKYVPRTCHHLM